MTSRSSARFGCGFETAEAQQLARTRDVSCTLGVVPRPANAARVGLVMADEARPGAFWLGLGGCGCVLVPAAVVGGGGDQELIVADPPVDREARRPLTQCLFRARDPPQPIARPQRRGYCSF